MTANSVGHASTSRVRVGGRYLSREAYERNLAASRAAKQQRRGVCLDCGAQTSYAGHGSAISLRCLPCGQQHRANQMKERRREQILDALRSYHAETGLAPRITAWDREPHFTTIYRIFGSWKAAVREAGFEPGKAGRPRKVARDA